MTYILNLYSNAPKREDENSVVEDISQWLDENGSKLLSDIAIGPFRIESDSEIKVALNDNLPFGYDQPKYASISIEGAPYTYYFYVRSYVRTANRVLSLSLRLDDLNTFGPFLEFDKKTHITRRHKDRFTFNSYTQKPTAIVDRFSENLSPALYQKSTEILKPDNDEAGHWYLIYQTSKDLTTENLSNPVSLFAVPDKPITMQSGSGDDGIYEEDLEEGTVYAILGSENQNATITADRLPTFGMYQDTNPYDGLIITKSGTIIGVHRLSPVGSTYRYITMTSASNFVPCQNVNAFRKTTLAELGTQSADYYCSANIVKNTVSVTKIGFSATLATFAAMSRDDSKLMKIVKLPYAPFNLSKNAAGRYAIPNGWDYIAGKLKCADVANTEMKSRPISNIDYDYDFQAKGELSPTQERINVDPKCYHSQSHLFKLSYDSYSISINAEDIRNVEDCQGSPSFSLTFKPSNAIASKFAFELSPNDRESIVSQDEYPLLLLSSRNNEMPIFTNDYINYIRTGYNFDLKKNAQTSTANWSLFAVQVAGALASAIATFAGGGAFTGAMAIGTATSAVSSLISNINGDISRSNAMGQRLDSLKAQNTQVAGTDDLNLFDYYSDSRLRLSIYEPSEEVWDMIDDLYYYYGYSCDEFAIPTHNGRYWFDFVQCAPHFTNDLPEEYLSSLSAKFQQGVTYFHHHSGWDLEQEKENWERSLIN